jgi:hypothetical protein
MRSTIALLAFLLLAGGVAFARAPTSEELPTAKDILEEAVKEKARLDAEREAELRDPRTEAIKAYADAEKTPLAQWKDVVEILKNDKNEAEYRQSAAAALRARFKDLRADERIRRMKKEIGRELVYQLLSSDRNVRIWVAAIFKEFWDREYTRFGYDPNETNVPRRSKAVKEWRRFLAR